MLNITTFHKIDNKYVIKEYNNKAKKSLNKYIKSLEGVFRYRDPKDYIQLIEPQQDSIIHIIPRKKKN